MPDLSRYLIPGTGPIEFIRHEIKLPDGRTVGEAMVNDEWIFNEIFSPVFCLDDDGLPLHRLVIAEVSRGHFKTGAGAAIAAAEAVLFSSTDTILAAADTDQARILGDSLNGFLNRNPLLAASFTVTRDMWTVPARDSRIKIIASDAPTSWGLGGIRRRFRVIADELTNWKDSQLFESLSSSTGKVENAQIIVLTNAGWDAERAWQWKIRETARTQPWGHLYAPPGVVASWIKPEWISQMRQLLPPAAYARVIENKWTSGTGDFVDESQWRRCVDERWEPQTKGTGRRYFAGLDLGLVKDRTALSIVHREGETTVLDDLKVWSGSRASPVSIGVIETALIDSARRFSPLSITVDPWQLKGSRERLIGKGLSVKEFTFNASSVQRLSQALYTAITSARLRVFPDAELEREILGLRVVESSGGWRFDHRTGGFSDRAVALGMAILAAAKSSPGTARLLSAVNFRIDGTEAPITPTYRTGTEPPHVSRWRRRHGLGQAGVYIPPDPNR